MTLRFIAKNNALIGCLLVFLHQLLITNNQTKAGVDEMKDFSLSLFREHPGRYHRDLFAILFILLAKIPP
jgi:hypothetical protein